LNTAEVLLLVLLHTFRAGWHTRFITAAQNVIRGKIGRNFLTFSFIALIIIICINIDVIRREMTAAAELTE
jgi:hypothetical protein